MDPRVEEHAELLVDWTAKVEAGETVLVEAGKGAHDLVVALSAAVASRGATPITLYSSSEATAAYVRERSGEPAAPVQATDLFAESDAVIRIRCELDLFEQDGVSQSECLAYKRRVASMGRSGLGTRRCVTQHPTLPYAERAGMSLDEYRDFVYGAILRDWEAASRKQYAVVEKLDDARTVRITGPRTDLSMNVEGMNVFSGIGDFNNMPDGEVGTAPNPESVEGHVTFDKPVRFRGEEIAGVELTFEDGRVVESGAARNEAALEDLLAVDTGARRVGEFGIGMNDAVDTYTRNVLFDEKMAGTIHVALGRAYRYPVPEDRERNVSAIHVDFLKGITDAAVRVTFDGEPLDEDLLY